VSIKLSPVQSAVFKDPTPNRVWIAGRRSGKSFEAVLECISAASAKQRAKVWYIGPTYDQVRDLAWGPLKALLPPEWVADKNETRMEMTLPNGSQIRLHSAQEPSRMRGPGLDFAVLDEFAFMDPSVWDALEPALADKPGRALFISTPCGYNWAYDLYMRGVTGTPGWRSWQTTTAQSGRIPQERLEERKANSHEAIYRQEYEASFETLLGRVYSNFDRALNVKPIKDLGVELLVGMDFNVHPMSYVVAQRAGDECHVLAAHELPVSNTEEVAVHIRQSYPNRRIVVCPDPSGNARKTSAPVGQTDFTILQRHGFIVDAERSHPPVVDRVNNVQTNLLAADGRRRLIIDPKAAVLIKALDGLTYKEGTNLPDKTGGLDHITDALGYLLWQRFNRLASRAAVVQSLHW
jgi:hypothetical protein